MDTNKVLSALCYFSIFFAGFLFPIVVYFLSNEMDVKKHAKTALFSHLIPVFSVLVFIILGISHAAIFENPSALFGIFAVFAVILLNIIVVIWNTVKGIIVLKN